MIRSLQHTRYAAAALLLGVACLTGCEPITNEDKPAQDERVVNPGGRWENLRHY